MKNRPLQFYGTVENGKLTLHKPKLFQKYIKSLKGLVSVEVKSRKSKRNLNANSYYWVCLTVLGDELGYTKEEMHALFGNMFRKHVVGMPNKNTGEIIDVEFIESTAAMSKGRFAEYVDQVIRWAAEMGVILLTPEEFYNDHFNQ